MAISTKLVLRGTNSVAICKRNGMTSRLTASRRADEHVDHLLKEEEIGTRSRV